jgi:hypothetical protein
VVTGVALQPALVRAGEHLDELDRSAGSLFAGAREEPGEGADERRAVEVDAACVPCSV